VFRSNLATFIILHCFENCAKLVLKCTVFKNRKCEALSRDGESISMFSRALIVKQMHVLQNSHYLLNSLLNH